MAIGRQAHEAATRASQAGTVDRQAARIATLEAWITDLQSGLYINCVYCGHRYGPSPGTPVAMADVLKAHIAQCPAHPMAALKAALQRIMDNDTDGCRCEHDDEHCCALADDDCCPFCIAAVALKAIT